MKIKKIIVFLIILISIITISTFVNAGDDFLDDFTGNPGNTATKKVNNALGLALGIIQVIGMVVAIVMLLILGMKYIMSAPNDRAEIKKHAVVYIVGAVIMFGAAGIVEIIKNFGINFMA